MKNILAIGIKTTIAIILIISFANAADNNTNEPSHADINGQIERVKLANDLTDSQKEHIISLLQLANGRLTATKEKRKQTKEYSELLTSAATKQKNFESRTNKLQSMELSTREKRLPLNQLEILAAQSSSDLTSLRKQLTQIETDTKNEKSFDVQVAIEEARQQLSAEKKTLNQVDSYDEVKELLDETERSYQLAQIDNLEQRLLSRNARLSLWDSEQKFLVKKITLLENRVNQLQALINDRRQNLANRRLTKAKEILNSLENSPQPLRDFAQDNIELANELSKLIDALDVISQKKESATKEAQKHQRKYKSLTEQLENTLLGTSPAFAAALRKQRDQMTDVNRAREILSRQRKDLIDSRLAQFRIDALREADFNSELEMALSSDNQNFINKPENQQLLTELRNLRKDLLENLSVSYWNYIGALTNLINQNSLSISQSSQYAELLDQHLFWFPSSKTISKETLSGLIKSYDWMFNSNKWHNFFTALLKNIEQNIVYVLSITLIILLMFVRKSRMKALLDEMKVKVGKVHKDKISLTLLATLITIVLALPGPFILLNMSILINHPVHFSSSISSALVYSSMIYFILKFVAQSAIKNGLLETHFRWNATVIRAIRKNTNWFIIIIIPMIILNHLIELTGNADIRDSLGRFIFSAETIAMAVFAKKVLSPQHGIFHLSKSSIGRAGFRSLIIRLILVVFIPVFLIIQSMYGYHYTAVQLQSYLINSAVVILSGIFLYCFAQRGFAINERKLALDRLRSKRTAARALIVKDNDDDSMDDAPSAVDLQEIDLQTISKQTKTLLRLVVFVLVGLALWNVWSGILPAFKPMVNVELWNIVEAVDGVQTTIPITLWNVFLALISLAITVSAARNISGVLEAAFISRLPLKLGTGFAITTIAQYLIVIIGSVITLQWLGAQWSKLQWLVAALSVGLGFGLQEIVANFVSGIVILFERPIRIGDTVTVGNQTGRISRISMRATTIVDWDRREIIVPNKAFVQQSLSNWTLTDPITRKIIDVGVAYGSNVDLVESTLLDVAKNNSKVLDDPPPEAYFLKFGESSLEFSLRIFVKGHREHATVAHELHKAIDTEFNRLGIVVAFPQRDLHLNAAPLEVHLLDKNQQVKTATNKKKKITKNKGTS
jgi:potassium efflux system protein